MKKLLIMLVLLCVGLTSNAQNYTREGNTFVSAKTGKEYKSYLGPEISQQICKELNVEYKGKKGNKV